MTISSHAKEFGGLPVREFDPETGIQDAWGVTYRLTLGYDKEQQGMTFSDLLEKYLSDPKVGEVTALVIGCWDGAYEGEGVVSVVDQLLDASDLLTGLRHLFLGDITYDESEISWIGQTDVSPLLRSFPQLEELRIRGSNNLSLGRVNHDHLKTLILESGGLGADVVQEVTAAVLPELEHLELWLGTDDYGGDVTIADVEPLLTGVLFPKLKYLGLRNSIFADEIAKAIAAAPILNQVDVVDLSLGTLSDEGAQALLDCNRLNELKKLDLHYHYLTDEMCKKLSTLDLEVDLDDQQEPDEYDGEMNRYCAVSE
ncbi:hypothetical protein Pan153_05910 [Gimesia panareensis]|uniref:Leucine Rich repeats (2 copies) n=1 Tax=Gimesia panareensis TaxID=2527978 RepID=A0A518FI02_9PLAN|nr:STM4015 family protein [Gimesia panareensis]QDV15972.1 hypothetical protein Pan153_05910 [Gimesia panareensis]